jgi:hypothetical protein
MATKRGFEEELAALDELRRQDPKASVGPLRKALAHRNNYVVAKAADIVRDFHLDELLLELLTAFDRFFTNPIKSDPQCWAKNAISRALAEFELQDADVFLRGMKHIQLEPVWGGRSDSAGQLRGTCALALAQCRSLPENDLLAHLVELFKDEDKSVRAEAVRAVEQVGSNTASLLLRLRAILGSDEPEVLGACYSGIIRLEGIKAIPWISRFLETADDTAAEAALAIAGSRSPEAFEALRKHSSEKHDPWFNSVLLSAIALTRQSAAFDFLLHLVRTESFQAEAAMDAVLRSMPPDEIMQQLEQLVSGKPRLVRVLDKHRASTS